MRCAALEKHLLDTIEIITIKLDKVKVLPLNSLLLLLYICTIIFDILKMNWNLLSIENSHKMYVDDYIFKLNTKIAVSLYIKNVIHIIIKYF